MDDEGTACEELEKESPDDPSEVEEEENRNNVGSRKRRRRKLIKDKVGIQHTCKHVCILIHLGFKTNDSESRGQED